MAVNNRSMVQREVLLFGRLSRLGASVSVCHQAGARACEVLQAAAEAMHGQGSEHLMAGVRLASESEVLRDDDIVPSSGSLSLLPPVGGG